MACSVTLLFFPARISIIESAWGISKWSFLFNLLGVTILKGKYKTSYFDNLIEKVHKHLFSWSNYFHSAGGKLNLIKYVLQSMPIHFVASWFPQWVTYRFEKPFVSVFWNNSNNSKHFQWVSWSAICTPTSRGGLGLCSLADLSLAFKFKQF